MQTPVISRFRKSSSGGTVERENADAFDIAKALDDALERADASGSLECGVDYPFLSKRPKLVGCTIELVQTVLSQAVVFPPHVRRAVHISELLGPRDSYQTIEASTLDLLRAGVILVDGGKRVVFCNKAAEELLSSSPGISRKGDFVHLVDPIVGSKLASKIDNALLASAGAVPDDGIPITLNGVGASPIAAWVLPLKRRSRIAGAETYAPIKTHLSRLFAKTDTKTQAQLVRLAMMAISPARMAIV